MFQFKIFSIAVIIAAFMFVGFVKSGEADIEIIYMCTPSSSYNYGAGDAHLGVPGVSLVCPSEDQVCGPRGVPPIFTPCPERYIPEGCPEGSVVPQEAGRICPERYPRERCSLEVGG